ncbi:hypothetical protein BDP27DRAFT_1421064 [Rhodocollybia butyracea]|uniref:Uncharacterized protein n=1 Tax=Rhodocollybia butyracea TaxID=206335 RepID=A0A9P5PU94_9AGAR|nr:hypothetical protein BDP27DRAFT_1421064 [Rhodocollybia butyracea]
MLLAGSIVVVLPAPVQELAPRTGNGTSRTYDTWVTENPGAPRVLQALKTSKDTWVAVNPGAPSKRPSLKRPRLPKVVESPSKKHRTDEDIAWAIPLVTLIGRLGQNLNGHTSIAERETISIAIVEAFNSDSKIFPQFQGGYYPDTERTWGPNAELREWIYFKLINHEYCIQDDPCFAWIARGDGFTMEEGLLKRLTLTPRYRGELYVGITTGEPARNGFKGVQGRPVLHPVKMPGQYPLITAAMQQEWHTLLEEFNTRFMAPLPST